MVSRHIHLSVNAKHRKFCQDFSLWRLTSSLKCKMCALTQTGRSYLFSLNACQRAVVLQADWFNIPNTTPLSVGDSGVLLSISMIESFISTFLWGQTREAFKGRSPVELTRFPVGIQGGGIFIAVIAVSSVIVWH